MKRLDNSSPDTNGFSSHQVIDSRRLLYFYHVARCGSFSVAESVIGVAQSAITRQIQQLESDLDTQLLERHGRGVTLTTYGEILFTQAAEILGEMSHTLERLRVARTRPAGQVSIAAFASAMQRVMPQIISPFLQAYPDVEVTVVQGSTGEVYEKLATGRVDVAILSHAPLSKKIARQKVLVEPMFLVASRRHPVAKNEAVSRDMLESIDVILPAAPHGLRLSIDAYLNEGGIEPSAALRADSTPFTKSLVSEGRFCTILPELAIEAGNPNDEGLVYLPFKPQFSRTVFVASLQSRAELPLVQALTRNVVAAFRRHVTTKAPRPSAHR